MGENYKNKNIDTKNLENKIILLIDNKEIAYSKDPDTGKFFSNAFAPYKTFDSLTELAHAIVDDMEEG